MKKRTAVIGALVSLMSLGQPLLIGGGAVLITAMLTLFSPQKAKGETWSCTYQFDGKNKKFLVYRQGNQFNNPDRNQVSGLYKIIDENKYKIHLYKTIFPDMKYYYAVSFDKKKRMFSMVALKPGDDTATISGPCKWPGVAYQPAIK